MNESMNVIRTMTAKKKLVIALAAIVCLVAVIATTALVTVALLTSSAAVSNVFTIGTVGITMTESKVDSNGQIITGEGAAQVDTNTYNLIPGKTYGKDPTVFINAGSESSYLFVLVRNDLEAVEKQGDATHLTIAEQLAKKGWAKYNLAATGWVYIYVGGDLSADGQSEFFKDLEGNVNKNPYLVRGNENYNLFTEFTIDDNAKLDAYGAAKIVLTAVAIQGETINNADEAWQAIIETYPYIHTGNTPAPLPSGN